MVTQVIERHIVRDLNNIFLPRTVAMMSDAEVQRIVGENASTQRQRTYLNHRVRKLEAGRDIFRGVMGATILK